MHGKDVELQSVVMRFGDFTAVHETDLKIDAGEFFSILGPSGCGKTTILRMVAGLLEPTSGRILIGGEDMAERGPNRRPTALIFQNLALFPLMTVWENVAFGLLARGAGKSARRTRAEELLALVNLTGQEDKKPTELSGGQRQRVAIARALAVEPSVLLLDEPLSALDLKLRQHMRAELKEIQRKTGITFIFITHDQGEALTMSDRIAVMKRGVVEQIDTTDNIYGNPRSPFVATFVGENNTFHGRVAQVDQEYAAVDTPHGSLRGCIRGGLKLGDPAILFVRPERLKLVNGSAPANALEARVSRRDLEGAFVNLFLESQGQEIILHITNDGGRSYHDEGPLRVGFDPNDAVVMPRGELSDE